MKKQNLYYLFVLLAAWLTVKTRLCAQGTVFFSEPITMSTDGNHALPEMLERIQHIYSTAIDFEEVPLEYPADMVISPVTMKSGAHPVFMRGGKLTVQLDRNDQTAFQAVQTVLAAYTSARFPGLYQAIDKGQRVDVIPSQTRSANGTMRSVSPIMDVPVSLNYQPRQVYQLLKEITAAISKGCGYKVYLGVNGVNESMAPPTELSGFSGENAQEALAQSVSLSYQLLFDPGEKAYFLNMSPIMLPPPPEPIAIPNQTPKLTKRP